MRPVISTWPHLAASWVQIASAPPKSPHTGQVAPIRAIQTGRFNQIPAVALFVERSKRLHSIKRRAFVDLSLDDELEVAVGSGHMTVKLWRIAVMDYAIRDRIFSDQVLFSPDEATIVVTEWREVSPGVHPNSRLVFFDTGRRRWLVRAAEVMIRSPPPLNI